MVLKSKFSVRNMKYEADLLNELKKYYDSVPLAELKTNIDFILHICNALENKIKKDKKKYKYDKKEREDTLELNKKFLKKQVNISLEKLEDELVLAQVSSKSLTTLKALKISELTK